MTFKNLTIKEIFIIIFAPALLLTDFIALTIFRNAKEFSFVYLDRPLFILLAIAIVLYALAVSAVVRKILAQSKSIVRGLVISALTFLAIYYVSIFIHPIGDGIFFLGLLVVGLVINLVLCLILSGVIKLGMARYNGKSRKV